MALGEPAKYGIIIVCFGAAIVVALVGMSGGGEYKSRDVDRVWMKDLSSGELFDVATKEGIHPPIKSPSGNDAVKAHVFACGNCDDDSKRFIAYLEKYLPEAHKMFSEGGYNLTILEKAHVVSEDGKDEWVPIGLPEGQAIVNLKNSKCGDDLTPCFPVVKE